MTKKSLLPFALGLLVLPLFGLGCNPFQSAQDRIASGIISGATGGKVTVDSNSGRVEIKDEKGGSTVALGGEAGIAIPSDFPSDVPIYPGSKAIVAYQSKTDGTATISLQTTDSADQAVAWYADQFKSWKEDSTLDLGDAGKVRVYSKDKVRMQITVAFSKDDNKTTIMVTRAVEK